MQIAGMMPALAILGHPRTQAVVQKVVNGLAICLERCTVLSFDFEVCRIFGRYELRHGDCFLRESLCNRGIVAYLAWMQRPGHA